MPTLQKRPVLEGRDWSILSYVGAAVTRNPDAASASKIVREQVARLKSAWAREVAAALLGDSPGDSDRPVSREAVEAARGLLEWYRTKRQQGSHASSQRRKRLKKLQGRRKAMLAAMAKPPRDAGP